MFCLSILIIALSIIGKPSVAQQFEEIGIKNVGESCERDINCIKNAYCRAQITCMCEPNYSASADKTMCLATSGLICQNDTSCATMTNAECRQSSCSCKDSFILDINNSSNCLPRPQYPGDPCQRYDECIEALERGVCIDNKCQCISSFIFVNQTNRCIAARGIYQKCEHDYECSALITGSKKELVCKNKECAYKDASEQHHLNKYLLLMILFVSTTKLFL